MAKANWLHLNTSGNSITVTADLFTGREDRTTTNDERITVKTTDGSNLRLYVSVTLKGIGPYSEGNPNTGTFLNTSKENDIIWLLGKSNEKRLTFSTGGNFNTYFGFSEMDGSTPEFHVLSQESPVQKSGLNIVLSGVEDPGKTGIYDFYIKIFCRLDAPIGSTPNTGSITVTGYSDLSGFAFQVSLLAEPTTLSVSPTSLTLKDNGTLTTDGKDPVVTVISNVNWSVE